MKHDGLHYLAVIILLLFNTTNLLSDLLKPLPRNDSVLRISKLGKPKPK